MNPVELTALLVLATAASFTPGPNTTLSTALAANLGFKQSLRFVLLRAGGLGAVAEVCAGGLGALVLAAPCSIGQSDSGRGLFAVAGAQTGQSRQLAQADASQLKVTFWQGVTLQFVNIKAWMLALTVVTGWLAGRADRQRLAIVLPPCWPSPCQQPAMRWGRCCATG